MVTRSAGQLTATAWTVAIKLAELLVTLVALH